MFYHKSFSFLAKCLLECLLLTFDYFMSCCKEEKTKGAVHLNIMDLTGKVMSFGMPWGSLYSIVYSITNTMGKFPSCYKNSLSLSLDNQTK